MHLLPLLSALRSLDLIVQGLGGCSISLTAPGSVPSCTLHFSLLHQLSAAAKCELVGTGGGRLQIPPGSCWRCAMT